MDGLLLMEQYHKKFNDFTNLLLYIVNPFTFNLDQWSMTYIKDLNLLNISEGDQNCFYPL